MRRIDYQYFTECVDMPCCVISVQKISDETYGEIRIIAANQAYKTMMGPSYYDNMLYTELVPQDNKFEDYCYRAAVLKQRMHAYVETRALHCWTDQTMIPLSSDRDDMGYCQFIFEFTQNAEADRMASVSMNVAETVIESCIRLMGTTDFKKSIGDVLSVIIEESEAMAARIMLVDHEKKKAVNFCERIVGSLWDNQRDEEKDVISYELLCSWKDLIGVSNDIIIQNEQDLADIEMKNPLWAKSMKDNHVESLVLIPLRREQTIVGYLYVVNFNTDRVVEVKEMIELMSFILGSEIYNHLLLKKLDEASRIDALTGINNRRAMIQRINELTESKLKLPYGILNIDLNGLKIANDLEGHDAGDRILVRSGELLKKIFYQDDVFRTGGDEFLVIISNIDEETFDRKTKRLKRDSEKNGISFAIGSYWSDGSTDFKAAFRCADERMYADKRDYYERNPKLKR